MQIYWSGHGSTLIGARTAHISIDTVVIRLNKMEFKWSSNWNGIQEKITTRIKWKSFSLIISCFCYLFKQLFIEQDLLCEIMFTCFQDSALVFLDSTPSLHLKSLHHCQWLLLLTAVCYITESIVTICRTRYCMVLYKIFFINILI
jgi:hypothetical protein